MKNIGTYAGWIVAVVALVAAGGLFLWGARQHRQLEQVQSQVDALKPQVDTLNATIAEKDEALKSVEAKVAQSQAKPSSPATGTASGESPKAPSDMASLLGKMMSAVSKAPGKAGAEGEEGNPMSGIAQMFSGEQGKEMARYSAEMALNMQYGDLFKTLGLAPDAEQRVRDLLKENLAEQITAGMEALQGSSSPDVLKQMRDDAQAKLRTELGAILSPEGLAAYDEYEATLPKRMLTQSFDMQLNMFAPGLAPEARTRARDVLVEELLPAADAQQGFGVPPTGDFESQIRTQQEGFGRARDRLAQELDETQLADVDRLIAQMQRMTEMSMRMMGSTRQPDSQPK